MVPEGDDVVEPLSVGLVESGVGFSVVEPLPGFDGVVVGVFPPQLVNIKGNKRIENKVLLLNFINKAPFANSRVMNEYNTIQTNNKKIIKIT